MKKEENKPEEKKEVKMDQNYPDTAEGWAASNRLAAMLVMEGATIVRPYGPFPKKTKKD